MSDTLIALVPLGCRMNLLVVSLAKRALLSPDLKAEEKLEFLERLSRLTDHYITSETISAIEPIDNVGYQITEEAKSADSPDDKGGMRVSKSCRAIVCLAI